MAYAKKIIVIILGIIFALVIFELVFRGVYAFYAWKKHEHNIAALTNKDTCRILCLGDSMTANLYPVPLEHILEGQEIGVTFHVIDEGRPLTGAGFVLRVLPHLLELYKPDIIIVMTGFNDAFYKHPYGNVEMKKKPLLKSWRFVRLLFYNLFNENHLQSAPLEIEAKTLVRSPLKKISDLKIDVQTNPDDAQSYVRLGKELLRMKKYEEAEGYLRKAIECDRRHALAYVRLADCFEGRQLPEKVEAILSEGIKENPTNWRLYERFMQHLYGLSAIASSNDAAIERLLKQAINADTHMFQAYAALGELYVRHGRVREAELLYKQSIEAVAKTKIDTIESLYDPFILLAWLYYDEKRYDEAIAVLNQSIEKQYTARPAVYYEMLAAIYREKKDTEAADTWARKASRSGGLYYSPRIRRIFNVIADMVREHDIPFIVMQYPMLDLAPLKALFEDRSGIIFIEHKDTFIAAVEEYGHAKIFGDMYAGLFGHVMPYGMELMADTIARVIIEDIYNMPYDSKKGSGLGLRQL